MAAELKPQQRSLALSRPADHGDVLHPGERHGTVVVWNKRARKNAWIKIQPEDDLGKMLKPHAGRFDRFLTVNQFYGWRLTRLLKKLMACYVDIDWKDNDGTLERMGRDYVVEAIEDAGLPAPNYVVETGAGIHLYWLIEPVPAQALPVWGRVQRKIQDALKARAINPDGNARDCARVLRMPGTRNKKTENSVVGWIYNEYRWDFHQLCDEMLGFRPTQKRRPKKRVTAIDGQRQKIKWSQDVHRASGTYRLWHSRYRDLITIADHAAFMTRGIAEGNRHSLLFLMANALSWFTLPDSVENEIIRVARTFTPDLPDSDIKPMVQHLVARATRAYNGESVIWNGEKRDARFYFKTETIRDWVGEDLLRPVDEKLEVLCPPQWLIEKEKKRQAGRDRVAEGRYKRTRSEQQERGYQAAKLRSKGLKQREIAEELGITQQAVAYLLQKYKKAPLL